MLTLLAGLAAGSAHVFTGPDHLAALAPLAVADRRRAVRVGAAWGLGHGTGVAALGGLGIAARGVVDVGALSSWSEVAVGGLLIAIGLWTVRRALRIVVHQHHHGHAHGAHGHLHLHAGDLPHDAPDAHRRHSHAAFGVGMLHGAAGTGHLFGVLPSLALPPDAAVVYLAAYLVAAVVSMTAFGGVLGRLGNRLSQRGLRRAVAATGVLAVAVGVGWIAAA